MTTISLLVNGNMCEAQNEAREQGVKTWLVDSLQGQVVLGADMNDYDRIRLWWIAGKRLVRTLGPNEVVK